MKNRELIEHTAYSGLAACGATLGDACANAAYSLSSIVTDPHTVSEAESYQVGLKGDDSEGLLFE